MGTMINACDILVREPDEKGTLGRYGRRWDATVKIDVKEIGCEGVNWIHLHGLHSL
jgi:hypothetical protein